MPISHSLASLYTAGANTGIAGMRVFIGPTDPISDIPVVMEYDHHQVHEGESFRWSFKGTQSQNAVKSIRIVVPTITVPVGVPTVARMPHFRFEVVSSGDSDVSLYESPSQSGGTQRTPVAMERNGTYTPQLKIYEDPTVTGTGSLIFQGIICATKGFTGDTGNSRVEFVLKNNTEYLLQTTSLANTNRTLVRLMWYEDLGV